MNLDKCCFPVSFKWQLSLSRKSSYFMSLGEQYSFLNSLKSLKFIRVTGFSKAIVSALNSSLWSFRGQKPIIRTSTPFFRLLMNCLKLWTIWSSVSLLTSLFPQTTSTWLKLIGFLRQETQVQRCSSPLMIECYWIAKYAFIFLKPRQCPSEIWISNNQKTRHCN